MKTESLVVDPHLILLPLLFESIIDYLMMDWSPDNSGGDMYKLLQ